MCRSFRDSGFNANPTICALPHRGATERHLLFMWRGPVPGIPTFAVPFQLQCTFRFCKGQGNRELGISCPELVLMSQNSCRFGRHTGQRMCDCCCTCRARAHTSLPPEPNNFQAPQQVQRARHLPGRFVNLSASCFLTHSTVDTLFPLDRRNWNFATFWPLDNSDYWFCRSAVNLDVKSNVRAPRNIPVRSKTPPKW